MSETPFEAPADDKAAPPPPHTRPRSLMIAAAMSAALGVFGLFGVAWGCMGSIFSLTAGGAFTAGMTSEQAAAQTALMEASRPFLFIQMALFLAVIPLAVGLLIGGINVLTDKVAGVGWLANAWLFGLVVEPVRWLVGLAQIIVLYDLTLAVMVAAAPPATPGLPANTGDIMTGAMIFSLVLGQAFAIAWMLAKVALYAWGRRVIASEATQDWILSKT